MFHCFLSSCAAVCLEKVLINIIFFFLALFPHFEFKITTFSDSAETWHSEQFLGVECENPGLHVNIGVYFETQYIGLYVLFVFWCSFFYFIFFKKLPGAIVSLVLLF